MGEQMIKKGEISREVHSSAIADKHIYIIAGPNGAGKTTFVRRFISTDPNNIVRFLNADLIAVGLSPFAPEREALQAGKLMLQQIDKLIYQGEGFCLETTLAGRVLARMIPQWQVKGFIVHLIFLSLSDVEIAINRVSTRVVQGGHFVPEDVIRRRFTAGLHNFHSVYKALVNDWVLYDNTKSLPSQIAIGENL